ncbi:MAG: peroxiredoxin [Gammaproteobacteria bacterium]|nr:peroxiredoxin [Gammaproteobacteria bacterium]
MSRVAAGRPVPDFSLPSTSGERFRLAAGQGTVRVLYFYPRDNTSGCTREGQDFNQLLGAFRRAGAGVYGISRDSLASHTRFRDKSGFGFELLADEDETVCQLFDVIRARQLYGRKVRGIERSTFLIDAAGVLRREWRKVKVEGHAAEVLQAVKAL